MQLPNTPPLNRLERALATRCGWVCLAIVVVSAALRIAYFAELSAGPCLWQHRARETDMAFFDEWARLIADGDWLTDRSLHPDHIWYRRIAEAYFQAYPDRRAAWERAPDGTVRDPAEALWDHWYDGKCFHQEPLYPYLIAATYRVFGPDVRWVFAWQMALGVCTHLLIYLIARRYFGELAAVVAVTLAVFCGPLLFFDLVLLRTTPTVFAALALVYLTGTVLARDRWPWWLLLGLCGGTTLLLQSSFVLFGCAVLGALVWRRRRQPILLARHVGALVLGAVLALAPAIARNVAVGVRSLALSSVAPIVFVAGNLADSDPMYGFQVNAARAARIMAATDGRFGATVRTTLRTHTSGLSYVRQLLGKLYAAGHWYEQPNNANFYYYRLHAMTLRLTVVTFAGVIGLGVVGAVLLLLQRRAAWPLLAMLLTTLVPMLLFYVLARFRTPLLATLLPLAGYTAVRAADWLLPRRFGHAAAVLAGVAALSFVSLQPLPPGKPLITAFDYNAPYAAYYGPLEQRARDAGDWQQAADILRSSLRYEPPEVRAFGPARRAADEHEMELVRLYMAVYQRLADDLAHAGQPAAAAVAEERARALTAAAQ